MMNCNDALPLMHAYLDGDAAQEEVVRLKKHLIGCPECNRQFRQLEMAEAIVRSMPKSAAPDDLTERIMAALPRSRKRKAWVDWIRRHPAVSVASVFVLVMMSSFLSMWNTDSELTVKGQDLDKVVIKGDTVYIPQGTKVNGSLTVRGGKVEVEGEVDGNLVVINGDVNLASTAHISGQVKPIDQALEWIWFEMNEMVASVAH